MSTKLPIPQGRDWKKFKLRSLETCGFSRMAHETRADWPRLMDAIDTMLAGAGRCSANAARRRKAKPPAG
ncbi:hypothetical protein [Sphingomonas sp.]